MSARPAGAERLAGSTWHVPGLTNSGWIDGLVVDTGADEHVYDGVTVDAVVVTHGHADHFACAPALRTAGARVLAPRDDASLVENPEVNIRGMFSWAKPSDLLVTRLFRGEPCRVDGLLEEWVDPRARAVPLPGHTLGHTGVLTADRVIFTGDALYQIPIWEKHPLPYAIDPALVARSLIELRDLPFDILVPAHGVPVGRVDALAHIEHHLERIDHIERFLADALRHERTTEDAIALVSEERGLSDNAAQYWLAVTTVKGYLAHLLAQGVLEFFVRDHAGWWKTV